MKIALIRQRYTPFGGAERYMARLVSSLLAAGHAVHVIAAAWETDDTAGVTFHRVPVRAPFGWLRAIVFARNARRLVANERFDLVFSLERTLRQDVYRAGDGCHRRWLRQKNLGKGWPARLATMLNPLHWTYLALERRLFTDPALRGVIANAAFVRDDIVNIYGVAPEKVRIVRNGLESAAFDRSAAPESRAGLAEEFGLGDELRLLYVGSGFERKGVPALIRAAARLSVPFRLFVVGKGRAAKYRRLAARLGIGDRVVFTGPRKDVNRFYLGCDVFAFPTRYDPFSNATLEAMAAGLPVVTSRFNGVAELIDSGKNGFVVDDPLDTAAIAAALERLAPPAVRERLGEEAYRTVLPLTMERNVRETLEVLLSVLPASVGGRPGRP